MQLANLNLFVNTSVPLLGGLYHMRLVINQTKTSLSFSGEVGLCATSVLSLCRFPALVFLSPGGLRFPGFHQDQGSRDAGFHAS
jgi:hypothetical protein